MYAILPARFFAISITLLLVLPTAIHVKADQEIDPYWGLYLGGRLGYAYNQRSCSANAFHCAQDDLAYGLFAGYDFGRHFALELSHLELSDSDAQYVPMDLTGKMRASDLSLKVAYPLYKRFRVYGKVGAAYWTGRVIGGNEYLRDNGVRPLVGAGLEMPLSPRWAARLEYQYIDQIGNDELGYMNSQYIGAALVWNFSSRAKREPGKVIIEAPPEPPPARERRIVIDEHLGGPLFEFDKTEMTNTAAIDPVVDILLNNVFLTVSIIGHTDSMGSAQYNRQLSEARASVVAKYLQSRGVSSSRIKIFGMGESQPVADNRTDEGRARNRRVEFVIIDSRE